MAENVLGSLFQDIADAIRSKTGGTDKMAPNDFPDEILSIVAGGSVEGDDGTAVRATTGWIYTDQSGIYRQTITHGLGVVPDLVLVSNGNWLGLTDAQKEANPLMFVWGAHSKFKTAFSGTLCGAACTIQGITLSNGNDKGIDEYSPTDVFISCPDNNTFEFGMSESSYNGYYGLVAPDDEGTEGVYKWIAITGMGGTVSDGSGSAEGCVTVTFMNGDTVLFARPVYAGDDCPDPIAQGHIKETPTKESTAQYTYTHNGWATADGGIADANALKNITADKTLYAAYTATVRKYTVTYYDDDGVTVLHTEQLPYGATPSYVPSKAGHIFDKWVPNTTVTGDMSYTVAWIAVVASGTCGTSAYWSIDSTGTLTISGTGALDSSWRSDTNIPASYRDVVTTAVVKEGITSLSNNSLSYMPALTSITIPSSVTAIPNYMCGGDTALTSVNLPNTITSIGYAAFYNCKSLKSITIPSSVTYMDSNVFPSGILESAVFEDTVGWAAKSRTATANLTSERLSDPAVAATYLNNTYRGYEWFNS